MLTMLAITFLYFLPSFLARERRNFAAIFLFNFFLGWTFIGWIIALIWACTAEPRTGIFVAGAPVPVYAAAGYSSGARFCSGCGSLAQVDGRYCGACGRSV
jgi:Superinfection immunity protein